MTSQLTKHIHFNTQQKIMIQILLIYSIEAAFVSHIYLILFIALVSFLGLKIAIVYSTFRVFSTLASPTCLINNPICLNLKILLYSNVQATQTTEIADEWRMEPK